MTKEPKKPGNSPGSGPEAVERYRVAKVAGQCRMRWGGVLGRVSTGAVG